MASRLRALSEHDERLRAIVEMLESAEAQAAEAARDLRDYASRVELDPEALREAVNAVLWEEKEGYYFDRDSGDGGFIRSPTIASLMPLWAGIPNARRAARLVEHVLDPGAYNTLIPLPSVPIGDPAFEIDPTFVGRLVIEFALGPLFSFKD